MTDRSQLTEDLAPTVPAPEEAKAPLRKRIPLAVVLLAIIALIAIANVSKLVSGRSGGAAKSNLLTRPSTVNQRQLRSYETNQASQAQHDALDRPAPAAAAAASAPSLPYADQSLPGPEADSVAPMTPAQRAAIYGDGNPNAPQHTSGVSQEHAEARQRQLAREKVRQDALNSDTLAIDFAAAGTAGKGGNEEHVAAAEQSQPAVAQASADTSRAPASSMTAYDFDSYQGQLYRVFEGTVLEGVVTNHIDGSLNGPILIMLTTDYYSHDHQQLLMPQGTRLIGTVQSVAMQGQRRLLVTFHRAVCPDGFSLDFDKYLGLDPIGTTGLSGHVDNHILSSFAAAAAIGGLGGLAQIGNSASVFSASTQLRDGVSTQMSQEGEQILNHFLNRLPVITLKEGSRARVYIGRDILIPTYAAHTVSPTL